jgi:hypothetical protein
MYIPSPAEEAGEQVSVNPLVPLGISSGIRLLVLWFEDADDLTLGVPSKITPRAPLRDHARMDALLDGSTDTIHNGIKLGLGHVSRLRGGQHIGGDGAHALGRLEDGVDDLEALFLALLLVPAALELGGDLVGPALEAGVDGLEVDARVSAGAAARTRIAEGGGQRRVFRGGRPELGAHSRWLQASASWWVRGWIICGSRGKCRFWKGNQGRDHRSHTIRK